ncbi:uncharacterized protein involved in exopolysaccharide biosynthesis [Arcticibacter tournemirensis]|uniref:Lipopolysaccharide biosynthesis protein n=1 Tax=Arcticibacter tournemirensis TaxID=699437 RepID=A0A5M9H790_9SPHI|nr:lipopolysaccharide biosynthesis protein [Arcticibacter tournemirensis]KAA8482802.1 lipopolysaccharide biosynthesis protein [Arcticibacter tournemirensis]TQM51103.1 uncharacterized protein involved in exopolysaccharide biosynthesis [Arcticibacter tournemirensis]
MEEIAKFLRLLKKHRLTLIIIPLIAVIITYFLVRNLPDSYTSQARISTGIVDDTQQSELIDGLAPRGQQVNQEFSNLMEMMRLKKMIDQVSYKLILHDFTEKPFRNYSKWMRELPESSKKHALQVYRYKYDRFEGLNLWDKDQNGLYRLLQSMNYDSQAILGKLKVSRAGDSDFINVEFESENPELSAFVVNTLSSEFIKYYTVLVKTNQRRATKFLANLLKEKKRDLDSAVDSLRDYKIRNRVLNLDEQSSQLYSQIVDYSNRKQDIFKSIASYTGALNEIDRKFEPNERRYLESVYTKLNQNILSTREELRGLYDLYIQNDFDPQYKNSIDSLQNIMSAQISRTNDLYITNPLAAKQELVQQKMNLEIQLDLSRYSMNTIETQLRNLNSQFDQLVPHEAVVQALERDAEVASQEYLNVLNRYNQSNMEAGLSVKLNLVQTAMPGMAQPSKKMLLVILSGILTLVFYLVILFVLFFIDNSILSARDLANRTQIPVLGRLMSFRGPDIDLKNIWEQPEKNKYARDFKESLRSIRFEIEKDLKGRIVSVSSISPSEGKTLLALSLSYAFKMTNKRVLLIDGNFQNPNISRSTKAGIYLEDYFEGSAEFDEIIPESSVTVLANRGGDSSVLEIADDTTILKRFSQLRDKFDLIIIETPSLSAGNQAKEWLSFTDAIVAVFEAGQSITDSKKPYIEYFKNHDEKLMGWVLNKVQTEQAKGKIGAETVAA